MIASLLLDFPGAKQKCNHLVISRHARLRELPSTASSVRSAKNRVGQPMSLHGRSETLDGRSLTTQSRQSCSLEAIVVFWKSGHSTADVKRARTERSSHIYNPQAISKTICRAAPLDARSSAPALADRITLRCRIIGILPSPSSRPVLFMRPCRSTQNPRVGAQWMSDLTKTRCADT